MRQSPPSAKKPAAPTPAPTAKPATTKPVPTTTSENLEQDEAHLSAFSATLKWLGPSMTSMVFHIVLLIILALVTITTGAAKELFTELKVATLPDQTVDTEFIEEPKLQIDAPEVDPSAAQAADVVAEAVVSVDVESAPSSFSSPEVDVSGDLTTMFDASQMFADGDGAEGQAIATMFGIAGTAADGQVGGELGLVGRFYDLKQNRARQKLPYSGGFPQYISTINRLAAGGYSESVMQEYYLASTQMTFSQIFIPANTPAAQAPQAFNVEKEVEPRGWFVHYSGMVVPPSTGEWRFVGFFDDLLIVYVNNQPVLDGSWVPMCGVGRGTYDNGLRQEFGGPSVSPTHGRTAYAGKWISLARNKPIKIDIVIGETPGGLVGGLLMVQNRNVEYRTRPDGTPILPLFATTNVGLERIDNDPAAKRYQLRSATPIWSVPASSTKKSATATARRSTGP